MDTNKFKKLYRENPEAPTCTLTDSFDSREEMNAYSDYRAARKESLNHAEAIEKLTELRPKRESEAELFAEWDRKQEDEQSLVRARSLRSTATGGPASV